MCVSKDQYFVHSLEIVAVQRGTLDSRLDLQTLIN